MARFRGPRFSLGLTGLHLAGPRVYFGGRRYRRRVTRTITVTITQPAEQRGLRPMAKPAGWDDVTRVELLPDGAGTTLVTYRPQGVDRITVAAPPADVLAVMKPVVLASFEVDQVAGTAAKRRG